MLNMRNIKLACSIKECYNFLVGRKNLFSYITEKDETAICSACQMTFKIRVGNPTLSY